MRLLMISHKETWESPGSPTGYATTGGFPFQVEAISELFNETFLFVLLRVSPPPSGLRPLAGRKLSLRALPEPSGVDFRRKLALLIWLPRYLPSLWRAIRQFDAVHVPVPGDIGLIGILLALFQRKPLFVRHCGTWAKPQSLFDRFLFWLLEGIAGGRNVVLATGGGTLPPSSRNPNIHWIFSTSLKKAELESMPAAKPWRPGEPPRLVTVSRLSEEKNVQSILLSLPALQSRHPGLSLSILGDGPARAGLQELARELGVSDWVVFHGNCTHDEVLRQLSASHLFVFPTRVREGFPKAVLEALACGLPVVASDVSVIPALVGECGKTLASPEPENIVKAVLELLEDHARLPRLGLSARQKASAYTLEAWQSEIARHLRLAWKDIPFERP